MGSCLSTQPGDGAAWPQRWRKRRGDEREGAAAAGGGGFGFFSSGGGGGGGKKLPGGGEMTEEELARVAGRTCANGASAVACLHTQQGRKGTNQDAMVVWEVSYYKPLFVIFSRFPVDSEHRSAAALVPLAILSTNRAASLSQLLAFTLRSLLRVNVLVRACDYRFGFRCCMVQGEKLLYVTDCFIRNARDFAPAW